MDKKLEELYDSLHIQVLCSCIPDSVKSRCNCRSIKKQVNMDCFLASRDQWSISCPASTSRCSCQGWQRKTRPQASLSLMPVWQISSMLAASRLFAFQVTGNSPAVRERRIRIKSYASEQELRGWWITAGGIPPGLHTVLFDTWILVCLGAEHEIRQFFSTTTDWVLIDLFCVHGIRKERGKITSIQNYNHHARSERTSHNDTHLLRRDGAQHFEYAP